MIKINLEFYSNRNQQIREKPLIFLNQAMRFKEHFTQRKTTQEIIKAFNKPTTIFSVKTKSQPKTENNLKIYISPHIKLKIILVMNTR